MTAPLLPAETSEAVRAELNNVADAVAAISAVLHTCSPAAAAHLRRQVRNEVGNLLDVMLATPPCSLCPPTGGCSAHTCRAG